MNYPNFSWTNSQNSQEFFNQFIQPPSLEFQPQLSNDKWTTIETKIDNFCDDVTFNDWFAAMEMKFHKFLDKLYKIFENHASSIHNIEVQLGQLVNVVTTRA